MTCNFPALHLSRCLLIEGRPPDQVGYIVTTNLKGGDGLLPSAETPSEQAPSSADCWARRRVLEKFCIGSLAVGELVVTYTEDLEEGQFFAVLKKRVEKYFRGNQARTAPLRDPPSGQLLSSGMTGLAPAT